MNSKIIIVFFAVIVLGLVQANGVASAGVDIDGNVSSYLRIKLFNHFVANEIF